MKLNCFFCFLNAKTGNRFKYNEHYRYLNLIQYLQVSACISERYLKTYGHERLPGLSFVKATQHSTKRMIEPIRSMTEW